MRAPILLLVGCLLCCLPAGLATPARAQGLLGGEGADADQPFDITADSLDHDRERGVYVARGNVRITQPDRVLTADWVTFSPVTQQGVAAGNVVIVEGGDVLRAETLHFRVDTVEGVVFQGDLSGPDTRFLMAGDVIQKTGPNQYVFDEGEFTSCDCPDDVKGEVPWKITAKRADLDIGGYGTARNTTFEVLGVPVLWSPYMIYPLKTDRATGFLFPEWNASDRRGNDIGLPFFWAVNDQVGLLFKASYLTDRGFMPSVLGEYVFGPKSSGAVYGAYIDDKDIDSDDPSTPFDSQRWAAEWIHDHYLPYDWRWVVDARFFSDNLYPFDFQEFSDERKDRFIESKTFVENRFGAVEKWGFYSQILWADDAQNPDDQDRDDFLLQRMPQVHASLMPTPITPLERLASGFVWSMDTDYTHYWAIDDIEEHFDEVSVLERVTGVDVSTNEDGETTTTLETEVVRRQQIIDDVFVDAGIEAIPDGEERNQFGDVVRGDGTVRLADGQVITAQDYFSRFVGNAGVIDPALGLGVDGSFDDFPPGPEGDGVFQEGEPIADRGHRVLVNPRIARPFRLFDVVEVWPELGWHGTFYQTDRQGFETRNLLTFLLDVRTRMSRTLELPFAMGQAVHLLEPRVQYTGITSESQSGNPLFTPRPFIPQQRLRQLALTGVTRDMADRIEGVNAFTLGAGNRFYVAREDGEGTRLFADVDVSIQYDFANDGLQALYFDGGLWPGYNIRADFNLGWDFLNHELGEALFAVGWSHPEGHDLRLFYRYVPRAPRFFENFGYDDERFEEFEDGLIKINQLTLGARWAVTRSWALTYRLTYSFEESLTLTNQVGVEYISRCGCWAVRLEVDDERTRGLEVNLRYRIIGLGDDTVRPFEQSARRTGRDRAYEDTY